jgi:hypothetical protein
MKHPATSALAARHPRDWVEPKAIADELGVHHQTVLAWIASGELVALAVGRNGRGPYRVFLRHLDEFFESRSRRDGIVDFAGLTSSEAPAEPATSRVRPPAARRRRNTGLVAA